jgi:hypothetical protein
MRSDHRRPPLPHWDKGQGFCRWCGEATKGKLLWHQGACLDAFFLATRSASQRRVCMDRDKGVCRACGLDTIKQERLARDTVHLVNRLVQMDLRQEGNFAWNDWRRKDAMVKEGMKNRGLVIPGGAWWQADHRKPLVEANGDLSYWAAENLQTLCHWCHAKKSAADNRRRKLEKEKPGPPSAKETGPHIPCSTAGPT